MVLNCSFYSQSIDTTAGYQDNYISDKDAKFAVSQIVYYCGLEPNFEIVEDYAVKNANAFIKKSKRLIKYNPDFLQRITDSLHTDWAAWSVLAHEIGHHLLGHTLSKTVVSYQNEIEADKFSGFILFQLGASLEESLVCITSEGDPHGSKTHPPKKERIQAITDGWQQAERINNKGIKIFKQKENPNINEELTHRIRFNNEITSYYLNINRQLIWYDNYANAILICQLEKSMDRMYEWYFILEKSKYAIDHKGGIWLLSTHGNNLTVGETEPIQK
jgi:CYTH domain-containing protein